jgi:hypothetical protein
MSGCTAYAALVLVFATKSVNRGGWNIERTKTQIGTRLAPSAFQAVGRIAASIAAAAASSLLSKRCPYTPSVTDLSASATFIRAECASRHTELLTAQMLATAGVRPQRKVLDLAGKFRCRQAIERRKVISF